MSNVPSLRSRRLRGFTLIELMVVVLVIAVLVTLIFNYTSYATDKAKQTKCAGQMRQIFVGISNYVNDHNGRYYTKEEIGNSSFRSADDKLGLPDLLKRGDYLSKGPVWMSPGARPELARYKNSYAWSRASGLLGMPIGAIDNPSGTAILWNNYTYTLPSVANVPEGGSSGGPRNAPTEYYYYSFENRTAVNFLYADGHVTLMVLKKEKPKSSSSDSGSSGSGGSGTISGGSTSEEKPNSGTGGTGGSSSGSSSGSPIDAKPTNTL